VVALLSFVGGATGHFALPTYRARVMAAATNQRPNNHQVTPAWESAGGSSCYLFLAVSERIIADRSNRLGKEKQTAARYVSGSSCVVEVVVQNKFPGRNKQNAVGTIP
jgi:hypothetical protein